LVWFGSRLVSGWFAAGRRFATTWFGRARLRQAHARGAKFEGRQNLIAAEHNDELLKYITGIVAAQKQNRLL
jgi:hypothetical protein